MLRKIRISLNTKLLFSILIIYFVIFTALIWYMTVRTKQIVEDEVIKTIEASAIRYSFKIKSELENSLFACKTLAQTFESLLKNKYTNRLAADQMIKNHLRHDQNILCFWTTWEKNAFDGLDSLNIYAPGSNDAGRFVSGWYRDITGFKSSIPTEEEILSSKFFKNIRENPRDAIIEPYKYSYDGKNSVLMTSISVCIYSNNKFMGVIGVDISLEDIKKSYSNLRFYNEGFPVILSNNGTIVSHKTEALIGDSYLKSLGENKSMVLRSIKSARAFKYFIVDSITGEEYFNSYVPVNVGNIETPWSFGVILPTSAIYASTNEKIWFYIYIGFAGLIVIGLVTYIISLRITRPLLDLNNMLTYVLTTGDINFRFKLEMKKKDEIKILLINLDSLLNYIKDASMIAYNISKGKHTSEIIPLSDNDTFLNSIQLMYKNLDHHKKEELKRREFEDLLRWSADGVAQINEVLHKTYESVDVFSQQVLFSLVKYIHAHSAAIYMEANNQEYELKAFFAPSELQLKKTKFRIGESYIGICAYERKTLLLSEPTDDLFVISSGLGISKPQTLLTVPLLDKEKLVGVLLVASLYEIKSHEVELIEKISSHISIVYNYIKFNSSNYSLLRNIQEQEQERVEHEEELRQTVEEMTANYEELNFKIKDLEYNIFQVSERENELKKEIERLRLKYELDSI